MIKVEHVVTPSPEQWEAIVRGMRNPMNSWDRSDSCMTYVDDASHNADAPHCFVVGDDDLSLMERLAALGTDHRKYMRMVVVYMDITAPLYWWKEFDTYKVGTVANSCSTMHKIMDKPFEIGDFSVERMYPQERTWFEMVIVPELETIRGYYMEYDRLAELGVFGEGITKKCFWDTLIQLLPSSYNQKRTVLLNYEVLRNMYHARKTHKLDEWRDFCRRIEVMPYSELITG